jgi:Zn-dependent protease with chaperone function
MTDPVKLVDLHPFEYEHPFDATALDLLQNTAGLDLLVRQFNKHAVERVARIQYTGSGIRVTQKAYPWLHRVLEQACHTLSLEKVPQLYLAELEGIQGSAIGVEDPIIVLSSAAIERLEEPELLYLMGHEIGHIRSEHILYRQISSFFPYVSNVIGRATLGIGQLFSTPIELALLRWSRMSELTADRVGLLCCQDMESVTKALMKVSGLPPRHYDKLESEGFLEQAREFASFDSDFWDKSVKFLALMGSTHPFSVLRAAELTKWVDSGEYANVVARKTRDRLYKRNTGAFLECRQCKCRLEGEERFCPNCGTRLVAPEPSV